MLRILVADGDGAIRGRLRALLNQHSGWQVCGEAATGPEALQLALTLEPQIVIIDLALPGMNGLATTRQIKAAHPNTEILVLTAHETDDLIRDALISGAGACVVKSDSFDHIAAAVDALCQHRPYLTQRVANAVLRAFLAHGKAVSGRRRPFQLLTAREREILQLLAEGRTNAEISKLLAITVKTVETHRATLMKKLGVSSLAELIRYAIRNSVVEDA